MISTRLARWDRRRSNCAQIVVPVLVHLGEPERHGRRPVFKTSSSAAASASHSPSR
ncbi:MAG: hypothetical protein M0C28_01185 [Candidatus Moduliflexus flocculans]|nr:hypothetical protein [Candidatus Moduliflexus flocculans]